MRLAKKARLWQSTTSARTAGAGTASATTTATTNRITGSNTKAGTWASINIIDTNCTASS